MNTAAMPSVLSPSAPSAPTPVPKGGHGETPFSHCLDQACEQPDETDPATAYASKDTPGSVPTKLETVAKAKSHAPRTDKAAAVATLATPTQAVRSDPIAAPASDAPILAAGKSDLSSVARAVPLGKGRAAPTSELSQNCEAADDDGADAASAGSDAMPDIAALLPGWVAAAPVKSLPAPLPTPSQALEAPAKGRSVIAGTVLAAVAKAESRADDVQVALALRGLPSANATAPGTAASHERVHTDINAAGDVTPSNPQTAKAMAAPPIGALAQSTQDHLQVESPAIRGHDVESVASMNSLTAMAAQTADRATAMASAHAPAPTAAAHVAATLDSPGFAPALATQVRWLMQDGVQQAQITLNPAEMGPVAVRILLDGRDARIDFSADLVATRNAIEASLPVLAAALDDSGLKLTGGGVHDGQAQREQAWAGRGQQGSNRHNDAGTDATSSQGVAAMSARSMPPRSLVDLVA